MTVDAKHLKSLIEQELRDLTDDRVTAQIRGLLVEPHVIMRPWDYGPDDAYPCWTVLDHPASGTSICYCESGFGPKYPWGLVGMPGDAAPQSMGMDTSWFRTFLQAYFDSFIVAELPIWRVFISDAKGPKRALTDEGSWDETWKRVTEYRERDPESRYDCDTSVAYPRD